MGQAPTIYFFKCCVFLCFLCCFNVSKCFKNKKIDRGGGVGVCCLINPSFSRIFGFFFNLTRPHGGDKSNVLYKIKKKILSQVKKSRSGWVG